VTDGAGRGEPPASARLGSARLAAATDAVSVRSRDQRYEKRRRKIHRYACISLANGRPTILELRLENQEIIYLSIYLFLYLSLSLSLSTNEPRLARRADSSRVRERYLLYVISCKSALSRPFVIARRLLSPSREKRE